MATFSSSATPESNSAARRAIAPFHSRHSNAVVEPANFPLFAWPMACIQQYGGGPQMMQTAANPELLGATDLRRLAGVSEPSVTLILPPRASGAGRNPDHAVLKAFVREAGRRAPRGGAGTRDPPLLRPRHAGIQKVDHHFIGPEPRPPACQKTQVPAVFRSHQPQVRVIPKRAV